MRPTRIRNVGKDHEDPVALFLKTVSTVSKGRIKLNRKSKIGELFRDLAIFGPLEYELCLYSLEATLRRKIADSFYKGGADKDLEKPVSEFIAQYLRPKISDDPVFVARQFMKFAKSAKWQHDEETEPGPN